MPLRIGWIATLVALLTAAANLVMAAEPPAAQTAPADNQYVIGPGDTLNVFVWNHPELSVLIPVRPDGQISTPLVENMVATLFWVLLIVGIYPYLIYPLLARIIGRLRSRTVRQRDDFLPTVTVITAAFNEAGHIEGTVRNKLTQDYPADKLDMESVSCRTYQECLHLRSGTRKSSS